MSKHFGMANTKKKVFLYISSLSTILRFARMELTTANCIFYPTLSIRLPELRETIFKLKTDARCYIRKKCILLTEVGEVKRKQKF
jgi:hypothetical protein